MARMMKGLRHTPIKFFIDLKKSVNKKAEQIFSVPLLLFQ